jgi:cytoskeletal protein CcmA (bactofilin family)
MLWKKTGKRAVKTSDLTAFIDEGSEIEGKYTFSGTVMLNGKFRGEIASSDTLIVGEKGIVHAAIRAGVVLISGQVVGNLAATERVELRGTARVFGDVETPVIVVEEGVLFEGHCRMTQAPQVGEGTTAPPAFPVSSPAPISRESARDFSVVSLKR